MKKKGIVLKPMLKILLFLILLLSIIGILSLFFHKEIIRFNYFKQSPHMYGIDVSHHQKKIDWPQLKNSKVQFVYIKATEGATHQDKNFVQNWNGAAQAGITPGAYHFFTFCRSGTDQAANFLEMLSKVQGKHLPIVIDVELIGNCPARPTPDDLAIELNDFLAQVKAKTGCSAVLYTTPKFYNAYLADHFKTYPLWLQSFNKRPKLHNKQAWKIWQFTNQGRVDGIDTLVDLNLFKGSKKDFEQFICHQSAIKK